MANSRGPTHDADDVQPEPKVSRAALLPNLITLGNAVCGFWAISLVAGVDPDNVDNLENLGRAAWLILIGMIFDVFDGRVARMTGSTSSLGAQLDSLSDLVTFGVAPAALMMKLSQTVYPDGPWVKIVFLLGLAYFLGATLRLARFNVEHDEVDEVTTCFKGMPTPAAAGCIAGLVVAYFWLDAWRSWELRAIAETSPAWVPAAKTWIARVLPYLAFLCGYAMVSNRLYYPHLANSLLERRQHFDALAYLVFGAVVVVTLLEPLLGVVFIAYLLWTPIAALLRWRPSRREARSSVAGSEGVE